MPDIVISTPARLLAHLKAGGNVKLKESVQTLGRYSASSRATEDLIQRPLRDEE